MQTFPKTGAAVAFCLGVEQGMQDNRVDAAYAKLASGMTDSQRIDLRNQQRDWQKKQAAFCQKKGKDKLAKIECFALTAQARADQLGKVCITPAAARVASQEFTT